MAISKPKLPPRKGYAEVEADGVRAYRPIGVTGTPEPVEPGPTTEQILDVLLGEVSENE